MTNPNTELLTITDETALEAFSKDDGVDKILLDAEKQAEELKKDADLSTDKSRKQIASNARKFAKLKTRLDALGKGSTDKYRETINKVNANRNKVKNRLDELRDQVRKPLTDWENKDKERCDSHRETIAQIVACSGGFSGSDGHKLSINELKENLAFLDGITVDESFEEFELEARKMHEKSLASVTQLIADEEKRLAEEAELEQLRQEKIEREAKERDEAIAREAKEKAEREAKELADKKALEEEAKQKQLEQEKQDAISRENRAKEQAKIAEENRIKAEKQAEIDKKEAIEKAKKEEQERIAEQQEKERLKQKELEANKAHVEKIHYESEVCLFEFVDEETAKKIVTAIAKGNIDNITINY